MLLPTSALEFSVGDRSGRFRVLPISTCGLSSGCHARRARLPARSIAPPSCALLRRVDRTAFRHLAVSCRAGRARRRSGPCIRVFAVHHDVVRPNEARIRRDHVHSRWPPRGTRIPSPPASARLHHRRGRSLNVNRLSHPSADRARILVSGSIKAFLSIVSSERFNRVALRRPFAVTMRPTAPFALCLAPLQMALLHVIETLLVVGQPLDDLEESRLRSRLACCTRNALCDPPTHPRHRASRVSNSEARSRRHRAASVVPSGEAYSLSRRVDRRDVLFAGAFHACHSASPVAEAPCRS